MEGPSKTSNPSPSVNPGLNPNAVQDITQDQEVKVNLDNLKTYTKWTDYSEIKKEKINIEGEENLISVSDTKYNPKPGEVHKAIYTAAEQNNWIRKLFVMNNQIIEIESEIKTLQHAVSNPVRFSFAKGSKSEAMKNTELDFMKSESNIKDKLNSKKTELKEANEKIIIINKEIAYKDEIYAKTDKNHHRESLPVGVNTAYDFVKYKYEQIKTNGNEKLYTNDTLDAFNKIDFIGASLDVNGYLDVINLIQIKSKKPSDNEIKEIQAAHMDYFDGQDKIAKNEIIKNHKLQTKEEKDKASDKFDNDIYELFDKLSKIDQNKKNNTIIDSIIGKGENDLTEDDWVEFAFIASNISDLNTEITRIFIDEVNSLDLKIFKNWLNNKLEAKFTKENKEVNYKKYSQNNIITGRVFKSVIYYKVDLRWECILKDLTY